MFPLFFIIFAVLAVPPWFPPSLLKVSPSRERYTRS